MAEPPDNGQAGRYEISGEIARGGIGVILKARDTDLGRDVALKVLAEDYVHKPELAQRFVEEAQIGGQLQHPGIVPVYELGLQASDQPYFSMQLIQGETLAALLEVRQDLSQDRHRFLGIFQQVCQTVAYAHARRVVHRDLKPANVMVGGFGEVQVIDWGLAKVLARGEEGETRLSRTDDQVDTVRSKNGTRSWTGSVMGTPAYMPPEQARGDVDQVDERSDVFGLGAILCEILTGSPPHPDATESSVRRRARAGDLTQTLARLETCVGDEELLDIATRSLQPDKADRPRNAGVLAREVAEYLDSVEERARKAELEAAQAQGRVAVERRARRKTAVMGLSIVSLLVVGGGALYLTEQSRLDRVARMEEAVGQEVGEARSLWARAREGDLFDEAPWQLADAALGRAESLVAGGDATRSVTANVETLRQALDEERQQADLDRETVRKLESVRSDTREEVSPRLTLIRSKGYLEAFKSYGIDVFELPVTEAGQRIEESRVSRDLLLALHDWLRLVEGWVRRYADRDPPVDLEVYPLDPDRLAQICDAADPDRWRMQLRGWMRSEEPDLEALRRFAEGDLTTRSPLDIDLLAQVLSGKGGEMRDLAIQTLLDARRRHPDDVRLNLDLAEILPRERVQEAMGYARVAEALRPQSAEVRVRLGALHRNLGEPDLAVRKYTEATKLRENDYFSYNAIGGIHREQGNFPEAIAAYEEATRIDPNAPHNIWLGEAYQRVANWDGAVEAYRRALEPVPWSVDTRLLLAWALHQSGRDEESLSLHLETVRLEEHLRALWQLGDLYVALGDWDNALDAVNRALAAKPDNPMVARGEVESTREELTNYALVIRRYAELEPQLATILEGELPKDADTLSILTELTRIKQLFAASARIWKAAFAADPALAQDIFSGNRYNAACAAALAAAGVGKDADITSDGRAGLRAQALAWVRDELKAWTEETDQGATLHYVNWWLYDPDMAGVRDEDALQQLPAEESRTWRALWADVDALVEGSR